MKNLLVLTLEFNDRRDVKRKKSVVETVDVTFTHGADYWFGWARKKIEDRYGFDEPDNVCVVHWSMTECGAYGFEEEI
jgi:hypothetical protein